MNEYKYSLEKYQGRGSRHVCPECGRKQVFTRYIDNDTKQYIADNVGKCSRLDKCGYHYTPKQYFADNPWKMETSFSNFQKHRDFEKLKNVEAPAPTPAPKRICTLPEDVATHSLTEDSAHMRWLVNQFGEDEAERIRSLYRFGGIDDRVIFWQRDIYGRLRTGKIMAYDEHTGKRLKESGSIDWIHALMRREGALPEGWELTQSLYGEHLLRELPYRFVAVVEAPKTAHVGAILLPKVIWVAVDSMSGLTAEKLRPLKGRSVILFPDEGKGYAEWAKKIAPIAQEVGFEYRLSTFMEGKGEGSDIADLARYIRPAAFRLYRAEELHELESR